MDVILTKGEARELINNYLKDAREDQTMMDYFSSCGYGQESLAEKIGDACVLDPDDFEDYDDFVDAAVNLPVSQFRDDPNLEQHLLLCDEIWLDDNRVEYIFSMDEDDVRKYSEYMPKSVNIDYRTIPSDEIEDFIYSCEDNRFNDTFNGEYLGEKQLNRLVTHYRVNEIIGPKIENIFEYEDKLEQYKEDQNAAGMKKAFNSLRSAKKDYKRTKEKFDNIYLKGLAFGNPDKVFEDSEYSEYDMADIVDDIIHHNDIHGETTFEGGETPLSAEEKTYYKEFVTLCDDLASAKSHLFDGAACDRREHFFEDETGLDYLDYCERKWDLEEWNEKLQRQDEIEEYAMLYGTDEISFYGSEDADLGI